MRAEESISIWFFTGISLFGNGLLLLGATYCYTSG
jgi:hypothetical protein